MHSPKVSNSIGLSMEGRTREFAKIQAAHLGFLCSVLEVFFEANPNFSELGAASEAGWQGAGCPSNLFVTFCKYLASPTSEINTIHSPVAIYKARKSPTTSSLAALF